MKTNTDAMKNKKNFRGPRTETRAAARGAGAGGGASPRRSAVSDHKGASLVFVLAVMLLLMAIGASALAAAGANAGAGVSREITNQLNLYADSARRAVWQGLQAISGDADKIVTADEDALFDEWPGNDPVETLGGKLLREIYLRAEATGTAPAYTTTASFSFAFSPASASAGVKLWSEGVSPGAIVIEVECEIRKTAYEPREEAEYETIEIDGAVMVYEIRPEKPRVPATAAISGKVTVRLPEVSHPASGKSLSSVTRHRFADVFLEDIGGPFDDEAEPMRVASPGVWSVLYE